MKNELTTNLNRQANRMKILERIAKGEQAIRENRLMSNAEAKEKMKKWLK